MIPTFRSMIVATLLTLMALVGGFGLFAAFRVNHEPLAQLPTSATSFALANNDAPPHALSFASEPSFGSRLESNAALVAINTASVSGDNPDSVNAVESPSVAVAPDSSSDGTPATVDTKPEDASLPSVSKEADPKTLGLVTEIDPKTDSAGLPPIAAMEVDPKAGNAEPPQPVAMTTPAPPVPQIAAVESASDQVNDQAALAAPAIENSQPESAPLTAASPGNSAPTVTATVTPTAPATATPTDEQVTAREIAKRKRLAAARRARRARVLAAAQLAYQSSLFPQANLQPPSQTSSEPAQQAVGGSFAPASAPAKARRQN
jgi:hypothetical protein